MIAKFRGGPMNRKVSHFANITDRVEVAKPDPNVWQNPNSIGAQYGIPASTRGYYSRTIHSYKPDHYYFVWMGWQ